MLVQVDFDPGSAQLGPQGRRAGLGSANPGCREEAVVIMNLSQVVGLSWLEIKARGGFFSELWDQ